MMECKDFINKLVEEGKRIKKNPWCASGFIEQQSAQILYRDHGILEQETMKETVSRRNNEQK